MARLVRIVVPGIPHHVTQRGNRRQDVFFDDADYRTYLALLADGLAASGTTLWAYCLMPNHVHLILVPPTAAALTQAIQEPHRRYTRHVNFKQGWKGYLWQGRYASFPMDEAHLLAAARYVELNPVRAGLVKRPRDWRWSSAKAHLTGKVTKTTGPLALAPLLDRVPDWRSFLAEGLAEEDAERLRQSERTGRPLGSEPFVEHLEKISGRNLKKKKAGRKPKDR
jgi:putative transposase